MIDRHLTNVFGALATGYADIQAEAMARAAALSPPETAVLLAAFTRPGSTIGEIARTMTLSHSGAVRTVDRLAKERLVQRSDGPDGRSVGIKCTAEGRKRALRALAARAEALEQLLAGLPQKDRATLQGIIERLLRLLPRDQTGAWRICRFCEHSVCRGADCPVGSGPS